ncbi:MAG: nuclear transport factor 2 family protein [Chloroflexota bacterium]|nr:nuclear transport factor 2 family protein [Chloroflexota bacterium]
MTVPPALLVHRALQALHNSDPAQLKRHLHADVVYDTGHELISGRDAVVDSIIAPHLEHLELEIIPGRVDNHGDHLTVQTSTTMRWKHSREVADINPQTLAIHLREGLIARLEIRSPPI